MAILKTIFESIINAIVKFFSRQDVKDFIKKTLKEAVTKIVDAIFASSID